MRRPRVLFVAGLDPVKDGASGGQLTQARALMASPMASVLDVVPMSSTMQSVPPPPFRVRLQRAAGRVFRFVRAIPNVDAALIFVSDGMSLVEKGVMCFFARLAGRGVVVRFGSGHLVAQCEANTLLRWWLRMTVAASHRVCSQGAFWTAYFNRHGADFGKIVEVRNGVELSLWQPARQGTGHRILFVGWVQREKGIFELLEALTHVRQKFPDCTLRIVGNGRDFAAVRERARALGLDAAVQAHGWLPREAMPEAMQNADVLALPSHAEGLPNVVLEAMASALPVVATPVGSIPDVIKPADTGLLVPCGDVSALANALLNVFEYPAEARQMGLKARRLIETRYAIDAVWPVFATAVVDACRLSGRTPIDVMPSTELSPAPLGRGLGAKQ